MKKESFINETRIPSNENLFAEAFVYQFLSTAVSRWRTKSILTFQIVSILPTAIGRNFHV